MIEKEFNISQFKYSVNQFAEKYNISLIDRIKLYLHYPLFKIYWYSNYGKGALKSFSKLVYPIFEFWSIKIRIFAAGERSLTVPVCFHRDDLASFREIFFGEEYKSIHKMDSITSIFDVGANTGMAALYFSANLPLTKLVLVEANPVLAKRLGKDFTDEVINVENLAIYGERGEMNFAISSNHRDSYIVEDNQLDGKQIVPVKTILIDDLLKKYELESVDLLKMDIEGAEYNILDKTPESFLSFKYIIIEIHGDRQIRKKFKAKLIDLGFDLIETVGDFVECETSCFGRRKVAS